MWKIDLVQMSSGFASVDLLHLRIFICSSLHLPQRRKFIVIVDAQSELDHAVSASRKLCWLVQVEP